jgi:hypothetical protein
MLGACYPLEALVARGACAGNDVNILYPERAQPDDNTRCEVELKMAHHAHMLAGLLRCANRVQPGADTLDLGGATQRPLGQPLNAEAAQPLPWQARSRAERRGAPSASGMRRVITMMASCSGPARGCA